MPESLFTLESLVTLPGAAWATYLIVSYTNRFMDRIIPKAIGTDIYAVLVGFTILLSVNWVLQGHMTLEMVILSLFNGVFGGGSIRQNGRQGQREEKVR
jgi:hypothetical protein